MSKAYSCASFQLCLLVLTAPLGRLIADDDLRPMFNGHDLTGWVLTNTPAETWSFEDGLLVCTGKPIGEIRTEKMYQNFVMELEWRHMVPRGNAGVFVWADDITSRGVPFHRGIEVQVLENAYGNTQSHTTHGDIFPIHGATMTPINGRGGSRAFPTENRSLASPQWNHYRIECRDGEISLAVNGKVVTRGKDCVPRKGYICLESEGGVVHYRNVRIQELPSGELEPGQIAIADRGYRSLYNGLDLDGWSVDGEAQSWKAEDWTLHAMGGETGTRLKSIESFEQLGFVVDVNLKEDSSRATITAGGIQVDLSDPRIVEHLEPRGRWNRIEGSSLGPHPWLKVNGHSVRVEEPAASGAQPISLLASGLVQFSNPYVRTSATRE